MRSRLAATALLPLLLLPACGSDEPSASGSGDAAAAEVQPGATLRGVLGEPDDPDAYTIALTDADGAPVEQVPAGDYVLEVDDPSQIHNFRLSGNGVDEATEVSEVTETTFEITLTAGEYTYVCDPHPGMSGTLEVV